MKNKLRFDGKKKKNTNKNMNKENNNVTNDKLVERLGIKPQYCLHQSV